MSTRTFRLVHATARQLAASWCMEAPDGYVVTFREPRRSDEQSRKMHAMAGDIAKQVQWCGAYMDVEDWKRVATAMLKKDKFVRDVGDDGMPGSGLIVVGARTREMGVKDMSLMIEWFRWFGAMHNVVWSAKATDPRGVAA